MQVEQWPVDRLKPYENNPRVIPQSAVEAVADSLKRYGFRQPIVVDGEGVIIVGHTRLAAARLLKMTEVPVHVAEDLTEDQARAYRVADNRVGELVEWDHDAFVRELDQITSAESEEDIRLLSALFTSTSSYANTVPALVADDDIAEVKEREHDRFRQGERAAVDLDCPGCGHNFQVIL